MSIDLQFDGSTECRGRNRWFQLREVEIVHWSWNTDISINFYSKTRGEMPPIVVHIHNPEELRTLICGLAKALAQMTTTPEED